MGPIFLGIALFAAAFVFLALFGRAGPTETHRVGILAPHQVLTGLSAAELGRVVSRIVSEMGFRLLRPEDHPDHVDLLADDPTPITGQQVYVRALRVPERGFVESTEVQSAMDAARGEGLSKAIVFTPGSFSEEAKSTAMDAQLELVDGEKLEELCRQYLPDLAARLGPVR